MSTMGLHLKHAVTLLLQVYNIILHIMCKENQGKIFPLKLNIQPASLLANLPFQQQQPN